MHACSIVRDAGRALPRALVALALIAIAAPVFAAVVHPTPEEVAALALPSELALSPDGRTVVYVLETARLDPAAKPSEADTKAGWTTEHQLWLLDTAGGRPRQFTFGADAASAPQWSPDGRAVAFLRRHEDKASLQLLRLDGGEAETVSTGALEPTALRWSPDGRSLAFTAEVPRTQAEKDERWRSGGVEAWGEDWRPAALYVVPRQGGEPRRVSRAPEHIFAFEWSPNGSRFAVLVTPSSDPQEIFSGATPRVISARDGALVRVLDPEPRYFESMAWSPDGARVALTTTAQSLSMVNVLEVCDVASGRRSTLSPDLDRTFGDVAWLGDSRGVVAVVRDRTESRLVRFSAAGGSIEDLGLRRRVIEGPLRVGPASRSFVFLSSWEDQTLAPTAFDSEGARLRPLADLNPQVKSWSIGAQEVVHWRNSEGVEIEGLLMRPPGARAGVKLPLLVFPHGGPDDVTTRRFSGYTACFAAHGYAVLRPNYRGSLAYGHDYYAANRGRFGEIETHDIESGVDALIAAGRVDPRRLYLGGWSWGGYISGWTLTHQTRYRAIVVGAGVNDVALSYSTSDINHGVSAQWEYKGDPWHQTENFDRANVIRFAKNAKTPTLILHGQADTRVAFSNSLILYRALRDVGCPVKFYAYPREDHNFEEPAHNAHVLRAWVDWYDSHAPGRTVASR